VVTWLTFAQVCRTDGKAAERSPVAVKIARDPHTQKLIAIKLYGQITEGTRTVWMDGRPHPRAYAKQLPIML
jgi:hypothetical protein